jgi:hypothetical protein
LPGRLFHDEDFLVMVGNAEAANRGMQNALRLLGGRAVDVSPEGAALPAGGGRARGIIASIDALAASSPAQIQALRRQSEEIPLLLFPARSEAGISDDGARVMRALDLPELAIADPAPVRTYAFSESDLLWPFRGLQMAEERDRVAAAVAPGNRGIDPLISSQRGCTFFRWRSGRRQVFVSMTSPLDAVRTTRLQDEFGPARFAGLLPLMLFARMSLGDAAWRTPRPRATFMIDDPNLRFMRYGFMDYRSMLEAARDRDLHFTIAMIPLDYRKTRERVAGFARDNRRYLSLVPHGVEHLKREFAREVPLERAVATLRDGLRRMRIHQEATGVSFPPAMTFPHGRCNSTWLEAMRRVGLHAAFAAPASSFEPENSIRDPLFEMYPAEMSFQGFPVVNRFRAEEPKERLLFQAWLGKPLVVYTHHGFFRDGMRSALDFTDFVDHQVSPAWGNIESILHGNYQQRQQREMREVRVFSNAVKVATEQALPISRVSKPGAGAPAQELARVDGTEVQAAHHGALGLVVHEPAGTRRQFTVSFEPRLRAEATLPYRTPLRAAIRRLATEVRDHSSPVLAVGRQRTAP